VIKQVLVTIFLVGIYMPVYGAVPAQGHRITGKGVADIPDQQTSVPLSSIRIC
jgi:hypothetical protein